MVIAALISFFSPIPNDWPHFEHRHDVDTELISLEPRIFMLRNILSSSECDQIQEEVMKGNRVPSTTAWKSDSGDKKPGEWRRSITGWIRKDRKGASPIVQTLLSRVASAANVSVSMLQKGNPLHVTEYQPGGFYLPHLDSRHVEDLDAAPTVRDYGDLLDGFKVKGGYPYTARYFTALCYLSDDFKGGNTVFPLVNRDGSKEDPLLKGTMRWLQNSDSEETMSYWEEVLPPICEGGAEEGIVVPPEKGSCVLFYNHVDSKDGSVGQADHFSLHAGCPISDGSKWIANVWGEANPTELVRSEGAKEDVAERAAYRARQAAAEKADSSNEESS